MINWPSWSAAVWVNILTSAGVALCCITLIVLAYRNRKRLQFVIDLERGSITVWLAALITFFVGRGVQIAIAGRTVASNWFLAIGLVLLIASINVVIVVLRNSDGLNVDEQWHPGMPDRRRSR